MSWKTMPVPPEGLYLGSGIYVTEKGFAFIPGTFSTWIPQEKTALDHLELIKKDNQGNLAQVWGWWGFSYYAMEDLGFVKHERDWKNGKNLRGELDPDVKDYPDREGAGLIKFIEKAREMGIYTTGLYSNEVAPEWAKKIKSLEPWWLGYDFGERYSFHLNRGSNDKDAGEKKLEDATLDDFAQGLIGRVEEHVKDRKAKGWGNVMATSGSFHLDYEIIGGTDIPVQEDFAFRHLTVSSAFGRGLFRQFRLPCWGSHIAHEHYSWIPYSSPYKYPLLSAAFYLKYMNGCKLIVNESGNWYTQVKLCPDSPMYALPYCTVGKSGRPGEPDTRNPYSCLDLMKEASKKFPMIDYRSPTAVRYRRTISDFWDFVKEHGTPAGQPEASFAIAKGNLDLSSAYCAAGNYAVASAYNLADINHDWYEGDPERSWKLIEKVFCPCPEGLIAPYRNQYLSATPQGVFDIVTFALNRITPEFLIRNYKALIFAGWNTCSPEQYAVLKRYVEEGGILCIGLHHLSTNNRRNYRSYDVSELVNGGDFSDLCGVKVRARGRRIYWATGTGAEPNELGVKVPRRFGILAVPIGELEITDPEARVVIADDEQFDPVVIRRKCGKGEVFFVNTWFYPGALDIDEGTGSVEGSRGLLEPVYKYIAKLARGNVFITDDGENPGNECRYVNCTYFPDAGRICMYNIDFNRSHTVVLHQFGYQEKIVLGPSEFRFLDSVKLTADEKQNDD